MEKPKTEKLVLRQDWLESERGWGIRPDGFSLHISRAALEEYLKRKRELTERTDTVPDSYSRPDGQPYGVDVTDEIYEQIENKGGSKRYY
jgi:hypothetical protein